MTQIQEYVTPVLKDSLLLPIKWDVKLRSLKIHTVKFSLMILHFAKNVILVTFSRKKKCFVFKIIGIVTKRIKIMNFVYPAGQAIF